MKHEEHDNQVTLFKWFYLNPATRGLTMFAIPNAHIRTPRQGAWVKAEGMMPGVPDIFLMEARGGYHGLFIEMKSTKGKPNDRQIAFRNKAHMKKYCSVFCFSFENAKREIEDYLALGIHKCLA
jgi:hypothetical protein